MSAELYKPPVVEAKNVRVDFDGVEVVHGVDLAIQSGALTLITGPSGSGKTTMMNVLGALKRPTSGSVKFGGQELTVLTDDQLTFWRGKNTGFAFQRSGLIPGLTASENIDAPHSLIGNPIDREWTDQVCADLGISNLLDRKPGQLSGGQQQRVAIARAMAHKPSVLFPDEPSAPLDTKSKVEVHESIQSLVTDLGTTVVMVSHDPLSEDYANITVRMVDGEIDSVL